MNFVVYIQIILEKLEKFLQIDSCSFLIPLFSLLIFVLFCSILISDKNHPYPSQS